MAEWDLRKLPIHRMHEAEIEARIALYSIIKSQSLLITKQTISFVYKWVKLDMRDYQKAHPEYQWMDFGDEYIQHLKQKAKLR